MNLECREVERIVWTDGPELAPASHLAECRACRDEARRAADLRAALSGMRNRFAFPPPTLEPALIAAATKTRYSRAREVVTHPRFLRGAAVGAAAAAATAAIGLIAARRRAAATDLVA